MSADPPPPLEVAVAFARARHDAAAIDYTLRNTTGGALLIYRPLARRDQGRRAPAPDLAQVHHASDDVWEVGWRHFDPPAGMRAQCPDAPFVTPLGPGERVAGSLALSEPLAERFPYFVQRAWLASRAPVEPATATRFRLAVGFAVAPPGFDADALAEADDAWLGDVAVRRLSAADPLRRLAAAGADAAPPVLAAGQAWLSHNQQVAMSKIVTGRMEALA